MDTMDRMIEMDVMDITKEGLKVILGRVEAGGLRQGAVCSRPR